MSSVLVSAHRVVRIRRPAALRVTLFTGAILVTLVGNATNAGGVATAPSSDGQNLYQYYCYQCHGYGGDAKTQASAYLSPRPRDFTRTSPHVLTAAAMREAVTHGRRGTAMVSFKSVLSASQINDVIAYIRTAFMNGAPNAARYHTAANGWPQHDRYAVAFPFARGDIGFNADPQSLDEEQRAGRRLFLSSCISCHDRGSDSYRGPAWVPVVASRSGNGSTLASASSIDEKQAPANSRFSPSQQRGLTLYSRHCKYCHEPDTSKEYSVGNLLDPLPPDLNNPLIRSRSAAALRRSIRDGIVGTSMSGWKEVLTADEIEDVIAYVRREHGVGHPASLPIPSFEKSRTVPTANPTWRRHDSNK